MTEPRYMTVDDLLDDMNWAKEDNHYIWIPCPNNNYAANAPFEEADADVMALRRVAKAAKMILKMSKHTNTWNEPCPHGIIPAYPTHAWWCDGCFGELETALKELAEMNNEEE
jgi:hypothetical protein